LRSEARRSIATVSPLVALSARLAIAAGLVLGVAAVASPAPALAAEPAVEPPPTLEVGTQTLTRCEGSPLAYCGHLSVPLDYALPAGPHISIAYRFYPASAPPGGHATGTVVPVEGGPGFPSIGSVSFTSDGQPSGYSSMYGPVLKSFNMLAVDNRGTGDSALLDCPALQHFSGPTGGEAFQQTAAECAAKLNHRWRYKGQWLHASDLFTSAPAAEDLAAVIAALGLGKVDLYGDSYGSYFAQVFASRYPHMLRSVVLDSTYETIGLDPFYRSTIESMPADFDAACERSPACAQAAPGQSWPRVEALAERLDASPITGNVPGPEGKREAVEMNAIGLVNLISDAAGDPRIYRDLDAAARALLDADDPAPLLRLYAQRLAEDEDFFTAPTHEYSDELYLAVACLDYPQLFSVASTPAVRASELSAAEAGLPSATFSPFSTEEWLQQDQNTEAYTACLDWPSPTIAQPPIVKSPPLLPASLPVLVLGGELDTWTPPAGVPKVLSEIGGHARFIELANSTHVVGEGDTVCGGSLVQAFVEEPHALDSLDASCAANVPPIHAVGVYASDLAEEQPLAPSPGSGTTAGELELAAAAISTAGDAISRYEAIEAPLDHGLHGGTVTATRQGSVLTLAGDELIPGVRVSGTVTLTPAANPEDGQSVNATLTASAAGVHHGTFTASWTTAGAGARATLLGSVAKQPISGNMPAP
jgi:pimeloyl-ACP methyl ester carboxylesterase